MKLLRIVTVVVALLLAGGEIARWWGSARFIPMALDEILIAAAMLAAAGVAVRTGAAPMAAAWGIFCGLMLALLVPTLDHLLSGPPKESAAFYAVVLTFMLIVGSWAVARALALVRRPPPLR